MAACNGYHIWCVTITAILLTSVVNAQFSMPLNDISDIGLGMMGIPPNSSITSTVHSIGKLLERPSVGEVIKRITKIMSGGMSTYMDNNNYTVNGECLTHMQMTMNALMNRESWALRMVDAIGKPHSDLMDLYIKWLGSYEECVNTKALIYANPGTKTDPTSPFKGKYCRAIIVIGGDPNQPMMTAQLTVGLCLPSSCNAADVQAFASTLVSLVPVNTTGMPPPSAVCQEDSLEYTTKAIAVLTVCAVIGAVIVIATIYDVAVNCFMVGKKRKHQVEPLPRHGSPSENGMVNHNGIPDPVPLRTFKRIDMDIPTSVYTVADGGLGDRKPDGPRLEVDLGDKEAEQGNKYGLLSKILVSFSLYTNLGRIMNTNQPSGTLTAVHGIRFISMSWVILGHAFSGGLGTYEQHISKLVPDMYNRITFHAIGNATFSVDTFFLLSGLLVGYLSLKELKKVKGVRHFNWIMFYFHRYWRYETIGYSKRTKQLYHRQYNFGSVSGYTHMDAATVYIINDACAKMDYGTDICTVPARSSPKPVVDYVSSNSFFSYLLEVVKGPHMPHMSGERSESDNWSIETLAYGIFPGTLWCGFGNIAGDVFGQLGDHSETDECCRAHDVCRPIIKAFQTRFHHSNRGVTPISHCGCDMQFYNCLKRVNSATSKMIGKIFFNLVKMKCFDMDVRETCTSSFLGICRTQSTTCGAILKNNKEYPT